MSRKEKKKMDATHKKKTKRDKNVNKVLAYKKRMLAWENPVEYVNNMYGSHPSESEGIEYFKEVFKNDE